MSGKLLGRIDLNALADEVMEKNRKADVLNGIAYDAATDRIFITGKNWPNLYEIKVIRGFADFDEDIICPECKTPHLTNVRTDGGYKVIKRFNKKELSEKEYKETIVSHLLATREEWDKKQTFLWDHLKDLPKDELCLICSKHLDQGFPGTMSTEHEGHTICFECMMSSRTLLIDYKALNIKQ